MLERQLEIEHSQGKVGICPFCQADTAELWFDPAMTEQFTPYQVRCLCCGARGPWADCGWGSAVPSWDMVGRKEGFVPKWRGPGADPA